MHIEEVSAHSEELLSALGTLVAQLDPTAHPPTRAHLNDILSCQRCRLLVAYAAGAEPVGMALVAWYPTLSGGGHHYWLEDVVVAEAARGHGVGEALVTHALHLARAAGAEFVDLTSRPAREAANRLYLRMGFERRETTVYRYDLRGG